VINKYVVLLRDEVQDSEHILLSICLIIIELENLYS